MKGVALAFNVHEPPSDKFGENYKFKQPAKVSLDEMRARVQESKQKKVVERQQKEQADKQKY